ncbi:uncharacterized protein CTRU02_215052 [Colletotrichum truncatum]|uniref:Uncharacterized protein n=1 Tax=Colletotrichum truncatum TaxID=5467 RepID=A0ACC3YEE7_COLTU
MKAETAQHARSQLHQPNKISNMTSFLPLAFIPDEMMSGSLLRQHDTGAPAQIILATTD